jgi:hypothetical protein
MCTYARTNVETPHVLETPSIIAATKYPRDVVGEGDHVGVEAVGGERPPDGGLAPIHHGRRRQLDVLRIWQMRGGAEIERVSRWVRGDFVEVTSRVVTASEVELLAVGRRRAGPAVSESPEVERRGVDCVRGGRDDLD